MAYPRKPDPLKVIEGTFRADRSNPDAPAPETEIPSCPPQLSPAAKAEWYRIAPLLENLGIIAKVNRSSLAAYCALYARWIKAEKEIQRQGEVIEMIGATDKETGEPLYTFSKKSPWVDISLNCAMEMRRYANEFGLTPASQAKVNAKPKAKDQKAEEKSAKRFFK